MAKDYKDSNLHKYHLERKAYNAEQKAIRETEKAIREQQRKNDKLGKKAFKTFGSVGRNYVNNFDIPFISGELSIPNIFYMIVVCMISFLVIRVVLFNGSGGVGAISFLDFIRTISNWGLELDFTSWYQAIDSWPAFLALFRPVASLVVLLIELLVYIMNFLIKLTLFIAV